MDFSCQDLWQPDQEPSEHCPRSARGITQEVNPVLAPMPVGPGNTPHPLLWALRYPLPHSPAPFIIWTCQLPGLSKCPNLCNRLRYSSMNRQLRQASGRARPGVGDGNAWYQGRGALQPKTALPRQIHALLRREPIVELRRRRTGLWMAFPFRP